MVSKPWSLPAAVNSDVSVVSAMAGSGARSASWRTMHSVARCCASAALPPLPHSKIFPPRRRLLPHALEHRLYDMPLRFSDVYLQGSALTQFLGDASHTALPPELDNVRFGLSAETLKRAQYNPLLGLRLRSVNGNRWEAFMIELMSSPQQRLTAASIQIFRPKQGGVSAT